MSNQDAMISLESYAAVLAGLGAGLRLGRALARAEVPPPAWEEASDHWQARIDESAATDLAVLVAFDAELSTARRRFEPTIEPIASDPAAWAQFRRHFITAVDPVAFLAERSLSLAAQARLEADWTTRLLDDAALAATFQAYMDAPLAECPVLTVTPSPWLLEDGAAPREAPTVAVVPQEAAAPIASLPPFAPPVVVAPVALPSYLIEPSAPPPPPPRPVNPPRVNPAVDLGRTRVVMDAPTTAPMPFVRTGAVSPLLPFMGVSPAVKVAVAAPGPRVDFGQTVAPSLSPVAAVTPFRPADPEAMGFTLEQYAALVAARQKRAGATPAFLAQFGLDAERHAALDAYWTRRISQNGMFAVDFARFLAAATTSLESAKPLEAVRSVELVKPVVAGEVASPLPELAVDQYAWIVAKLRQAAPADLAGALATVRLNPETREQLEAHWRARMGRDPALQQAFITALGRFMKGKAG